MTVTLALGGDLMLGRGVARVLQQRPAQALVAPEVVELTRAADLCVVNLECCISRRGQQWPAPGKPFFFRAPPHAVEVLTLLGVDAVTLANNHALDYGTQALLDTLEHLRAAGIATAGAGADLASARRPAILHAGTVSVTLLGVTDHPADFAARADQPGVAWADLPTGVPAWLTHAVGAAPADLVLVSPHWGPNMTNAPVPHVRRAAAALHAAGASLVAGHSAHVVHGVADRVLYDLGGFLDDYAPDPVRRNDLGALFLVELGPQGPECIDAVPLKLEFCRTRLAAGDDAAWIRRRFRAACAALGTEVVQEHDRLLVRSG